MFVFSGIYQLPFGKGKRFLSDANTFTDNVLGGWSVGSIITLDVRCAYICFREWRRQPTRDGRIKGPREPARNPYLSSGGGGTALKQWLNPAAFAQPAQFTLGNESRNDLHDPSFTNVDFNATKTFSLFERSKLVFKAEMFNIFNHTNYSAGTPPEQYCGKQRLRPDH